jgi:hypothetical protein
VYGPLGVRASADVPEAYDQDARGRDLLEPLCAPATTVAVQPAVEPVANRRQSMSCSSEYRHDLVDPAEPGLMRSFTEKDSGPAPRNVAPTLAPD